MHRRSCLLLYCLVCVTAADRTNSTQIPLLANLTEIDKIIDDAPPFGVRIVGGNIIPITDAPYQVSIRNADGKHFCGGTIISDYGVLTAAHCIVGTSRRLYVVAGVNKVDEGELVPVAFALVHRGYSYDTMMNDIAILRMRWSLGINNITKKALPIANTVPPDRTMCSISGWGSTIYDPDYATSSMYLRKTIVPVFSRNSCSTQFEEQITLPIGQICAGFENGGHDSCQGDSGGPLECNGQITGIVSWGQGCGSPKSPGVYTSVPYFHQWVLLHKNSSVYAKNNISLISFTIILILLFSFCNTE